MKDEMTPKEATSVSGPEGGRRPTGGPETEVRPLRFWAKHKVNAVLRLLRGESLETLSRELAVSAAQLSQWREAFLAGGTQGLSIRSGQDEAEVKRLNAKIGELTMANELLNEKIDRLEQQRPLPPRRSKK